MLHDRAVVGLTVGATGALLALGATPAMADDHGATVPVPHAVPVLVVDVHANGEGLIPDSKPGTLTDPLELPSADAVLAGTDTVAIGPAELDLPVVDVSVVEPLDAGPDTPRRLRGAGPDGQLSVPGSAAV